MAVAVVTLPITIRAVSCYVREGGQRYRLSNESGVAKSVIQEKVFEEMLKRREARDRKREALGFTKPEIISHAHDVSR